MKLVSILSLACVLGAAGCSSTSDTTGDGGTDGGTDTNTPPLDTGSGTDSTPSDTPSETGGSCSDCITANCKTQNDACAADSTCKTAVDCIGACSVDAGPDASKSECENTCITNAGGNAALSDFIACVQTKCPTQCTF